MKRVLSGIQPTGHLHLGNYLGAMRHWVELQNTHECLFCVVDLHAVTIPQDPHTLRHSTRLTTAAYLAAGINPQTASLFVQSHVAAHSELSWLLSCFTPLGWLNRMTQFKEKSKNRDTAGLGLYAYPVLMAADILVYKTTHVPVGADQKQHLELARDVAGLVNRHYNVEFFTPPEPLILGEATRVMSLRDGTAKMSKSDPSEFSRIGLMDSADIIAQKVRKAKTDSEPLPGMIADLEHRPEAKNLVTILAALQDRTSADICREMEGMLFSRFKQILTDTLVEKIVPIGRRMQELMGNPDYLDTILHQGAVKALSIADTTMAELREIMGFLHRAK
jgi:tryptophanyl-tRNA synthetase